MLVRWKNSSSCAFGLVFFLSLSAFAGKPGGKGGGGSEPPPESPVKFELHWLGTGSALDMNEAGIVVGTSEGLSSGVATMFGVELDPVTGQRRPFLAQDLNVGATWIDLADPLASVNSGDWLAVQASGINNLSQVVGIAVSQAGEERPFLTDPFAVDRVIALLPSTDIQGNSLGTPTSWMGPKINDNGVIAMSLGNSIVAFSPVGSSYIAEVTNEFVGRVDAINNEGMIVGWNYGWAGGEGLDSVYGIRLLPDPNNSYSNPIVDYLPGYWLRGLSNAVGSKGPMICGDRPASGKGKSSLDSGLIRLPAYGEASSVEFLGGSGDHGWDINGDGDSIAENGWLYHDKYGPINLRDASVVTNADEFFLNNSIRSWHISERVVGTESGMIAGHGGGEVFLLTPQ